jgi:hypothetical protein
MLTDRLRALEAKLDGADEGTWADYARMARALAAVSSALAPSTGQLLSTQELAESLNVSTRQVSAVTL